MTNVQPKRVVALIASATEIVCALGARNLLVGRSHECDFPPDVACLPALTEPKFAVTGASYDIDARVKAIVQEGLSVYRVDAEKLEVLRPDIIITQDHCEVCAVSLKDVEAALCAWGEALVLGPNINAAMSADANAPALEALTRAKAAPNASAKERALIAALATRYSPEQQADRPTLDKAYADAMIGRRELP
jgi:hypothetical protein